MPKVGPKTAAKWLGMYDTLDGLIAKADEIKGKVGESLRDSLEQLPLSRALTAIKCDVELEHSVEELVAGDPDVDALRELFERYEFKTWRDELVGEAGQEDSATELAAERNYDCVLDKKSLNTWLKKLKKAPLFAFDTETTSLDYMEAELVGVSFAITKGCLLYTSPSPRDATLSRMPSSA